MSEQTIPEAERHVPIFPTLPDAGWPVAAGFWAAAQREHLAFPKCSTCGTFAWYPMTHCPDCRTKTFEWTDVGGHGVIDSFTVVRRAFLPGTSVNLPHYVLRLTFDDVPRVALISALADRRQASSVRVGARVEMVFPFVGDGFRMPLAAVVEPGEEG